MMVRAIRCILDGRDGRDVRPRRTALDGRDGHRDVAATSRDGRRDSSAESIDEASRKWTTCMESASVSVAPVRSETKNILKVLESRPTDES